jgi:hypothetical protein
MKFRGPKALLNNILSIPTNGPDRSIAKYRILTFSYLTENRGCSRRSSDESRDPMLTRREFLATTAGTAAAAHLYVQDKSKVRIALSIPNEATGLHMPVDFVL